MRVAVIGGLRVCFYLASLPLVWAAAAHPLDPARKVLVYDMEGLLYELDMKTYEPRLLVARAAHGWHGKGMYSGQGVVVAANNGEHAAGLKQFEPFRYAIPNTRASTDEAGVLAEWTPTAGPDAWRLICRRQFTDVTGPGGIHGPPSHDAPLWALGWDEKSVLLLVRSAGDASVTSMRPARPEIHRHGRWRSAVRRCRVMPTIPRARSDSGCRSRSIRRSRQRMNSPSPRAGPAGGRGTPRPLKPACRAIPTSWGATTRSRSNSRMTPALPSA